MIALAHAHVHRYDKPTVNDILGSPYDLDASCSKSMYMTVGPTAIFLLFQYAHAKICELEKRVHFTCHHTKVAADAAERLCMAVLKP